MGEARRIYSEESAESEGTQLEFPGCLHLTDCRCFKMIMGNITLATISVHQVAGGLERNIIRLANHLVSSGNSVNLVTFDLPGAIPFYRLDNRVNFVGIGECEPHQPIGLVQLGRLVRKIYQIINADDKTETVICFHHGILFRFLLAARAARSKIICSERNALEMYEYISSPKWGLNFCLMALVDKITVQFPEYVSSYPALMRKKISVVPNPVEQVSELTHIAEREKIILSVGRYEHQKQFKLLVRAFSGVHKNYPDWRLVIIGDGSLSKELVSEIARYDLQGSVSLLPPKSDVRKWYRKATVYCQPSKWEGFPNAQAEAMAHGMIPVGFSSTRGVAELIEDGRNGVLCGADQNAEQLRDGLLRLFKSPTDWDRLSREAKKSMVQYSPEKWANAWAGIIEK